MLLDSMLLQLTSFRLIVICNAFDFGPRFFHLIKSFGQRRGFSEDSLRQRRRRARAPGAKHTNSLPSRTKSSGRDKIEITRTALKQSRVTSRSSSRRGRVHVIKQEAEEIEDESDGCSSDVDVGNELEVLEPQGSGRGVRRGVKPLNPASKIPEMVDLAMSSDDEFFMEPAGSSDEELIQEQDKVEEEMKVKRGKAKEGSQASGSMRRTDGNPDHLSQDESPLPVGYLYLVCPGIGLENTIQY